MEPLAELSEDAAQMWLRLELVEINNNIMFK